MMYYRHTSLLKPQEVSNINMSDKVDSKSIATTDVGIGWGWKRGGVVRARYFTSPQSRHK